MDFNEILKNSWSLATEQMIYSHIYHGEMTCFFLGS